jgi:Secretion system C-terminal sorting domain
MKRVVLHLMVLVLIFSLSFSVALAERYVVNGLPSDTPAADNPVNQYTGPYNGSPLDEVFLNFDELNIGGTFGSGLIPGATYAEQGITFQGQGELLNESGNFSITNYSSPNFLAFNTGAGVSGPETLLFDPPVGYLTLLAGHSSSGTIMMDAYDSGGSLVASDQIDGFSALALMSVEAGEIASVVLSFTGTVCCFDDFTFEEGVQGPVTLELTGTTVVIPPGGGNVVYDAHLVSTLAQSYNNLSFKTYVTLPNGQVFGPMMNISFTLTPFMDIFQVGLTQDIPANAPGGEYTFTGRVSHPGGQFIEDSFTFEKTGVAATGVENWDASEFNLSTTERYVVNGLPSDTPAETVSDPASSSGSSREPIIDEVFINFDELDAPPYFSDAIALTNEYEDQGVIFEGQGEVLHEDGNFGIFNYSSPNFLAFNTGAGVSGPETMLFDPPAGYVNLLAGQSSAGTITMNAYDSDGDLVASDEIFGSATLATMSVEADQIASVVLSFTGTVCCFDDIAFEEGVQGPVTLELTGTTVVIPPGGGNVVYDAHLVSTLPNSYNGMAFKTYVTMPNGQVFGPMTNIPFTLTPFMDIFQVGLTQNIPSEAPGGEYMFTGRVIHTSGQFIEDSFTFEKTGVSASGVDNWDATEFNLAGETDVVIVSQPSDFALQAAYPNPFNAATVISVTLPDASDLTVVVYNVSGQQVAELANGQFNAGQHSLTFDASNLASGLYFVRATVPGQMNATQKVMLVR